MPTQADHNRTLERVNDMTDRLMRIRNLHYPDKEGCCAECGGRHPCLTARITGGAAPRKTRND
jgi:hypothetical protein